MGSYSITYLLFYFTSYIKTLLVISSKILCCFNNKFIKYSLTDEKINPYLTGLVIKLIHLISHLFKALIINMLIKLFLCFIHIISFKLTTEHFSTFHHISHGLGKYYIYVFIVTSFLFMDCKMECS